MYKYCFIGCSKRKKIFSCQAKDLYAGHLFYLSYQYGKSKADSIYILSAKYGLIPEYKIIPPYDLALKHTGKEYLVKWQRKINRQIKRYDISGSLLFLAPEKYLPVNYIGEIHSPLKNLSIGKRIGWLHQQLLEKGKCNDKIKPLME